MFVSGARPETRHGFCPLNPNSAKHDPDGIASNIASNSDPEGKEKSPLMLTQRADSYLESVVGGNGLEPMTSCV